jgi:hypothetical protein
LVGAALPAGDPKPPAARRRARRVVRARYRHIYFIGSYMWLFMAYFFDVLIHFKDNRYGNFCKFFI